MVKIQLSSNGKVYSTSNGKVLASNTQQVQSDWAQNDSSEVDYIKNKPTIPEAVTVDQTYDSTSENAQSGIAIAGVLADKQDKLTEGTNITIAADGTISATDTTYSPFIGATSSAAGSAGLVPTPIATDNDKFLKGDGTWAEARVTVDDSTVSKNSSNQLQAIAIKNKNGNITLPIWEGTEQQWKQGSIITWYNWKTKIGNFVTDTKTIAIDSYSWQSLAYGNGVYVAITVGDNITAYSIDGGETWVEGGNLPRTQDWYKVRYCNDRFIAVSFDSQYAAYSTDGINWTEIVLPVSKTYSDVCYGNNIYVMVPYGGSEALYSYDSINWTKVNLPISGSYTCIAYGDGKFVATDASRAGCIYSTNGISWSTTPMPSNAQWMSIAYGGGMFVAVAFGSNKMAKSTDGISWSSVSSPNYTSMYEIIFSDGIFMVALNEVDKCLYCTPSEITYRWKEITLPTASAGNVLVFDGSKFITLNNIESPTTSESYQGVVITLTPDAAECFTKDSSPSYSTQIYSAPETLSSKIIVSTGEGTITLSDSLTYEYTPSGNQNTYGTIGEAHPDWLANVEGVGVKIGNTLIAGIPGVVDQVFNGSSTNAQSGTAIQSAINTAVSSVYKPAGSVSFANLPTPDSSNEGKVYNVNEAFITDSNFVEGSGKSYPAGTNVVVIDTGSSTYKFDALTGFIDLSNYVTTARTINNKALSSDITLNAYDVGALPSSTVIPVKDNSTITENSNNQLQTIAVLNKNTSAGATNPLNLWEGTSQAWTNGEATPWYYWQTNVTAMWQSGGSLPSSASWWSLAYGDDRFVAVCGENATSNIAAYSTDGGETWQSSTLPSTGNWDSICYGNNRFVAVEYNHNDSAYSTDGGETWQASNNSPGHAFLAYGDGRFVAVGNGYNSYTNTSSISTDGVTWNTGGNLPSSARWVSITYGDGRFVAISGGPNDTSNIAAYSTDGGETWQSSTLPSSANWQSVAYGNGRFVAVSGGWGNTSNIAAYSTDGGETWQSSTLPSYNKWMSIAYGDGRFVAVGYNSNDSAYSTDGGETWQSSTLPSTGDWVPLAYGDGRFIGINNNSDASAIFSISYDKCYTLDQIPTTSTQVYLTPETLSGKTITSTSSGTITLSDNLTYNYTPGGNQNTYRTIGDAHPDWLCNVEGVGVKIGNTLIASIPGTVDQIYNSVSTNAQSGKAIDSAGFFRNNATSGSGAIAISTGSYVSDAQGLYALAIGSVAQALAPDAIQIGPGSNTEPNSLYIGLQNHPDYNYKLLGSDGLIPTGRLAVMIGADGTNAGTKGAVPAPTAADNTKFLRGDGTWAEAGSVSNDTQVINFQQIIYDEDNGVAQWEANMDTETNTTYPYKQTIQADCPFPVPLADSDYAKFLVSVVYPAKTVLGNELAPFVTFRVAYDLSTQKNYIAITHYSKTNTVATNYGDSWGRIYATIGVTYDDKRWDI